MQASIVATTSACLLRSLIASDALTYHRQPTKATAQAIESTGNRRFPQWLGPLTTTHRRGFFLHSAFVIDAESRQAPETPARKPVPLEWAEVLGKITRRPRAINTVREFMRAPAGRGGFLGRKSDGEPGWQTIPRGLETLILALRGYHAARKKCG